MVVMKSWCFKIKINHYCLFFQWSCDGAYTLNMNSTCTEKLKAMILWKMYVLLSINFLEAQNSISGQNPFRGNVWKKERNTIESTRCSRTWVLIKEFLCMPCLFYVNWLPLEVILDFLATGLLNSLSLLITLIFCMQWE